MSRETNVAAQEKFGEAINSGKFEAFDDVVAPTRSTTTPHRGRALARLVTGRCSPSYGPPFRTSRSRSST